MLEYIAALSGPALRGDTYAAHVVLAGMLTVREKLAREGVLFEKSELTAPGLHAWQKERSADDLSLMLERAIEGVLDQVFEQQPPSVHLALRFDLTQVFFETGWSALLPLLRQRLESEEIGLLEEGARSELGGEEKEASEQEEDDEASENEEEECTPPPLPAPVRQLSPRRGRHLAPALFS